MWLWLINAVDRVTGEAESEGDAANPWHDPQPREMQEQTFHLKLLKDPLREETRKERRNLLGTSAVGIVMVKTGLIPTKISALGIEFSDTNRVTLLRILAGITVYFLVAFIIYAISDFWAYRVEVLQSQIPYSVDLFERYKARSKDYGESAESWKAANEELQQLIVKLENGTAKEQELIAVEEKRKQLEAHDKKIRLLDAALDMHEESPLTKRAGSVAKLRLIFEIVIPIALGVYSITILIRGQ